MSIRGILQITALVCIVAVVKGQDSEPVQPRVVDPGNSSKPPSDAIPPDCIAHLAVGISDCAVGRHPFPNTAALPFYDQAR